MTRLSLFLLLLPVFGCDNSKLIQLEKENRELAAKVDALTNASKLALQDKCAKQAQAVFKQIGGEKEPNANYMNHYSKKLDKCFVEIFRADLSKPPFTLNVQVRDAFEGRTYGEFFEEGFKPGICQAELPSGERQICRSQLGFDELVKVYMEQ